jgi:hypothetical protein
MLRGGPSCPHLPLRASTCPAWRQLRARDDPHNGDRTFAPRTITLHGHVEAVNPTSSNAGLTSKHGTGDPALCSQKRSFPSAVHFTQIVGSCTADVVANRAVAFRHPDWRGGFDLDLDQGAKTPRAFLHRCASEKVMVSSYHLPFPGMAMSFAPEPRSAGFQAIELGPQVQLADHCVNRRTSCKLWPPKPSSATCAARSSLNGRRLRRCAEPLQRDDR